MVLGTDHSDVAQSLDKLVDLSWREDRYAEAPLYERAIALKERKLGKDNPKIAEAMHSLARFYADLGHFDAAESLLQRALLITSRTLGEEDQMHLLLLESHAEVLRKLQRGEEASRIEAQIEAIQAKQAANNRAP